MSIQPPEWIDNLEAAREKIVLLEIENARLWGSNSILQSENQRLKQQFRRWQTLIDRFILSTAKQIVGEIQEEMRLTNSGRIGE